MSDGEEEHPDIGKEVRKNRLFDCFSANFDYLGRFRGSYPRNAALKCVSRDNKVVYVVGKSRRLRKYVGHVETLPEPNTCFRGTGDKRRRITYRRVPRIRYVKQSDRNDSLLLDPHMLPEIVQTDAQSELS